MRTTYAVILGIILPCVTLGFELMSGASAESYFDPIPTPWHALLVAVVPLANLLVLAKVSWHWGNRRFLSWLNGIAIGIATVYALVYLPITPMACIAIIFFGMGLLPLSPLLSLVAAAWLRNGLSKAAESEGKEPGTPRLGLASLLLGACLGVLAFSILEVPTVVTAVAIDMANSESPSRRQQGLDLLRTWGNDARLLEMCYGRTSRSFNLTSPFLRPLPTENAQQLYFRVTGKPFNSVTPPRAAHLFRTRDFDFDFDRDLGGQVVAGRRKGLSLASSRLDATIAPDEATAYFEWTMVFRNEHWRQREARAQVLLPPGGVVSRLTLWVDGEPREAAFSGTSKVREAYRRVAVEQRRDPVLVTWAGVDRVLMQCFPVPPNGEMKIRLGITAPLELGQAMQGRLHLPWLLERNFGMREEKLHAVWIESPRPLSSPAKLFQAESEATGRNVLTAHLTDALLNSMSSAIDVSRAKESVLAWAKDPSDNKRLIEQKISEVSRETPDRIVVVVDGSASMAAHLSTVAAAVVALPPAADVQLLVASDAVVDLSEAAKDRSAERLSQRLRTVAGKGGCDNIEALVEACRRAAESRRGAILWLHGPLPVVFDSLSPLQQRLERRAGKAAIWDLQLGVGPNRIVQETEALGRITTARCGTSIEELTQTISRITASKFVEAQRSEAASEAKPAKVDGSGHLARLWASEQVVQLLGQGPGKQKPAMDLAVAHQIVTPVSGAVVLENAQQYREAGLEPVDPDSVPTIPEPELWLLLAVVLLIVVVETIRRGRRCRCV